MRRFLVLWIKKTTFLNLQLLKVKIEKLTWVDSVIAVIDVPLLKSTDENLMDRLKIIKIYPIQKLIEKEGLKKF